MDDKWIDDIKTKMEGFETTPPEGLWDSVQKRTRVRKARNRVILTTVAASIALVIGCFFALVPENPVLPGEGRICDGKVIKENPNASCNGFLANTAAPKMEEPVESVNNPTAGSKNMTTISTTSLASGENTHELKMEENPIITHSERIDKETSIDTVHPETLGNTEKEPIEYADTESVEYADTNYGEAGRDVISGAKSEESGFSIGIATSANGIGGIIDGSNLTGLGAGNFSGLSGNGTRGGGFSSNSPSDGPTAPTTTSIPTPIEAFDHRLPLRFSLTLSFPVLRNLNVDTGITYSYLKSYIRYGDTREGAQEWVQGLHYLGIPLNIRYIPWRVHHLDFYALGGAMIEKCIAGSIKGKGASGAVYSYEGCDERPYQFSLNAAVGLQYNITRKCGIFLEPGVGFYFKNGSHLRTIYSERPLTFNLNLGIRID